MNRPDSPLSPWAVLGGHFDLVAPGAGAAPSRSTVGLPFGTAPSGRGPIPAYLLIPDGVDAAHPAPAVAVWHQHNGQWQLGKVEPAGMAGMPMHHTGVALVQEGYVVLCPDALCFSQRQHKALKGGNYERFEFLRYMAAGKCMAWNILDMRRAIDYLCSRPEVQKDRIGCYGHSMGSTFTWLVGPREPWLKCLLGNCCLPTYKATVRYLVRQGRRIAAIAGARRR